MPDITVAFDFLTDPAPYLPQVDFSNLGTQTARIDLPSGDTAVLYSLDSGDRFQTALYLQLYPADGDTPDPILISASDPTLSRVLHFDLALGALEDGSLVMTWRRYTTDNINDVETQDVRMLDAARDLLDVVHTPLLTDESFADPQILPSGTGAFARLWVDIFEPQHVYLQHHAADGTALADPILLLTVTSDNRFGTHIEDIVQLADGAFAVSWTDTILSADVPPYSQVQADNVLVQIVEADGTPRSGPIMVGPENSSNNGRSDIAPTSDGGFVILWQSGFHFNTETTQAQRYDATGDPVGDAYTLPIGRYLHDAIALSDERFLVAHLVDDELILQQFAEDGTALTSPEVVWHDMGLSRFESLLTLTADGRLVVTYLEETREIDLTAFTRLGDGDDAQTLTEAGHLNGQGGNDNLTGSGDDDALIGGAGADILSGGEGNDRLDGGDGADALDGGTGDDRLIGFDGDDLLRGDAGNDTLIGGFGRDALNGGDGDDLLMGDDSFLFTASLRAAYQPIGADLSDTIIGGQGNDMISGGMGNDLAYGGTGNDSLDGGLGADTLIGQEGNDALTGGAWGDVLFGGAGGDFLNGGSGYDRLNGGAGADAFFHASLPDHGSDWIQDFSSVEGDHLTTNRDGAQASWFQVNLANTPGAGDATIDEAFVIFRPTGQILWAIVDGAAQDAISIRLAGIDYDLLA